MCDGFLWRRRNGFRYLGAMLTALSIVTTNAIGQEDRPDFDRDVAPILIDNCLDCHSGAEAKGGLNLADAAAARRGGESGAAIVPGKFDVSLLWQRVESDEMPPKKSLGEQERQTLQNWITAGAKWGTSPIDGPAATGGLYSRSVVRMFPQSIGNNTFEIRSIRLCCGS